MNDEFKEEQYDKSATVKFDPKTGFEFNDLDGMFRAAQCYLQSGFAPPAFRTPQQLIMAWARGAELGLRPMQAIEGLTVINNRIGIMGDLALAMVRQSGLLAKYAKEWSGEGDSLTCKVTLQRKGDEEHHYTFSVAEAKHAGIYERSVTWRGYPKRMTYYRALGFGLRDDFSDVLKNMYTSEELEDLAHFENLASDKANVRFVPVDGTQEGAADTSSHPTTTPPSPQTVPPLQAQLAREHPDAAAQAERKEERLMGPAADFTAQQPDDIDMSPPADTQAPPPEKPWWVDHVIKGIRSFTEKKEPDGTIVKITRTVGSLTPTEMGLVEAKWIPIVHKQMSQATDAQLEDLKALEARLEHDKTAKPW